MLTSEAYLVERSWTGVETSFASGLRALEAGDILVRSRDPVTLAETTLTAGVHHSVAIVSGLAVITPIALPTAPKTLIIERRVPATNLLAFANTDRYDKLLYEKGFDKAMMAIADLKGRLAVAEAKIATFTGFSAAMATQAIDAISATTTVDCALGQAVEITLKTATTQLAVINPPVTGQKLYNVLVKQDATGGRLLTVPTTWRRPGRWPLRVAPAASSWSRFFMLVSAATVEIHPGPVDIQTG